MTKRTLIESLEILQETDGMDAIQARIDWDRKGAKKNFMITRGPDTDAYEDGGPPNSQGYGQQGIGRGGVGWGGRPDVSGGTRVPSAAYENTWDEEDNDPNKSGTEVFPGVEEGADFDEIGRHGAMRNLWRDTPDGKDVRDTVNDEEVTEAMGSPSRIGPSAPMDGPAMHNGRSARPVKDVDGEDVSARNIPDIPDPMIGPGNMWGGPGIVPGMTKGWANAPVKQRKNQRENAMMRLYEFFDPRPIAVEEIDNPDQDKHGDSTDDEFDLGVDDSGTGHESYSDDVDPDHFDDDMIKFSVSADDAPLDGEAGQDGDDREEPDSTELSFDVGDGTGFDVPDDLTSHDGEVAQGPDGADEPESLAGRYGGDNIMLMPHAGHGSEFVSSPTAMGAARGNYGMQADGASGGAELVGKSSAWDVLHKVVNALGEEDVPTNTGL